MFKISTHLTIKAFLAFFLVFSVDNIQAREKEVNQRSAGECSPNIISTSSENGIITNHHYCTKINNYYDKSLKKLNRLEDAQYQLLLAKNQATISTKKFSLIKQINEPFYSLWLEVNNLSDIEVSNFNVNLLSTSYKNITVNKSDQTYISEELPDSIINSQNLTLRKNTRLLLKVATSLQLKSTTPSPSNDWCLYDISERSNDTDIQGYTDAQSQLQKSVESNYSEVKSIPMAFQVSYLDVFHRKIVFPIVQHLRFANTSNSNYVFYPSKLQYEKLKCINF